MASPSANSPVPEGGDRRTRRRTSTVGSMAQSVRSVTQTVTQAAGELLQRDPPPGFFAATADAASHAPTIGEIRGGSFDTDGWHAEGQIERRRRTLSQSSQKTKSWRVSTGDRERFGAEAGNNTSETFPVLTEEPTSLTYHDEERAPPAFEEIEQLDGAAAGTSKRPITDTTRVDDMRDSSIAPSERIKPLRKDRKVYSSGYIPPPVIPWTTSAWIALQAFLKWVLTPFGFFITIYGLNVVAWGGMLFLLLCNASAPMCWSPVPSAATEASIAEQRPPVASLNLRHGAQLYYNCNDLNSPRRIWLEIDSQILNALFCVTGFGLIPWRFRDLYYLLLWRLTSEKRSGRQKKLYGLRKLAGIYRGWFRLPGSQTLDEMSVADYDRSLAHTTSTDTTDLKPSNTASATIDLESQATSPSAHSDPRIPLPITKRPDDPLTSVRAPATILWKLDFFVWSQAINTFLQACLCGFMWGLNRYTRPSWATGFFIALACVEVGLGGYVSYLEGSKVKKVEGVRAQGMDDGEGEDVELEETRHLNGKGRS